MAARGTETEDKTIVLDIYYCQSRPKLRSLPQADRTLSGCHQSSRWPECFWVAWPRVGLLRPRRVRARHAVSFRAEQRALRQGRGLGVPQSHVPPTI